MPRETTRPGATDAGRAKTDLPRRVRQQQLADDAARDRRKRSFAVLVARAAVQQGIIPQNDLIVGGEVAGDAS